MPKKVEAPPKKLVAADAAVNDGYYDLCFRTKRTPRSLSAGSIFFGVKYIL